MYLEENVFNTIRPNIFFLENKKSENLLKSFKKIVLSFEFGTRFQDLRENNHHFSLFSIP